MDAAFGAGGVAPKACRTSLSPQSTEGVELLNRRRESSHFDVGGKSEAGLCLWVEADAAVVAGHVSKEDKKSSSVVRRGDVMYAAVWEESGGISAN